jgi:ParB-like chromosome segregation protein Spo0J
MVRRICLAGALLLASGGAVLAQARAEIVGPIAEIPRQPYKTWALFLICNPDWVAPQRAGDLANLYWRFRSFGDAIGKDNLAVWFWTKRTSIDDPRLAEAVNVARSADYCIKLKLRPTAGPFVVVTSEYPDLDAFPRDRAVFELGGLAPADTAKLLNALTDELVLEGKVDAARAAARPTGAPTPAAAAPSDTSSLWIRLLEGARRSMIGFGCSTSVKIDTGVLSAELRECPTR